MIQLTARGPEMLRSVKRPFQDQSQTFYLTHCFLFFPPYLLLVWLGTSNLFGWPKSLSECLANSVLRHFDTSFRCLLTPFISSPFYIFTVVVQVEVVATDCFAEGPWKNNAKIDLQKFRLEYHYRTQFFTPPYVDSLCSVILQGPPMMGGLYFPSS